MAAGASAVVLTGSHARGTAHAGSDIDIHAVGDGPPYQLSRREAWLVSVSWRSESDHRESFDDLQQVGGAIPGWRSAVILADPSGVAARLKREATEWTWDRISQARIETEVCEWVTGFAEEVQKLAYARETHDLGLAAVQRSVLATRLALPMAVHCRILHDTENHLWRLVGESLGSEWTAAQGAALGTNGEPFDVTCDAALQLFEIACQLLRPAMNDGQRAVVDHAIKGARQ